jgi:hypothetical protein
MLAALDVAQVLDDDRRFLGRDHRGRSWPALLADDAAVCPGRAVSGNLGTDRRSCPCRAAWCRFPAVGTARNREPLDDGPGLLAWSRASPRP